MFNKQTDILNNKYNQRDDGVILKIPTLTQSLRDHPVALNKHKAKIIDIVHQSNINYLPSHNETKCIDCCGKQYNMPKVFYI